MAGKRKVTLTLDEDLCAQIEKASRTFNIPKSQLARKALRLWLEKETAALMAEGYAEMAEEDRAFADLSFQGQKETIA